MMSDLTLETLEIWTAGLDAVRAEPLVRNSIRLDGNQLMIDGQAWSRDSFDRIVLIGGGKAGTAMARGFVDAIDGWLPITGWINVPAGTEAEIRDVKIHAARPASVNEPTAEGVLGTSEILSLVSQAGPRDLCVALISGGGSALLPAPIEGITLQDKQAVTRSLSSSGADITELNTVRKHLSQIKGGGLLKACHGGHLITLILSDVLGDPLDVIASGPTVVDSTTAADALAVLAKYDPDHSLPASIYTTLNQGGIPENTVHPPVIPATNLVIGNNAVAVDHAGIRAEQLGYNHVMQSARQCEGAAEQVGKHFADMTLQMLRPQSNSHRTDCLITGGEPIVKLAPPSRRGRGGRNQQLVLAAYRQLLEHQLTEQEWQRLSILSGGTDGEDGPTDAAGAIIDGAIHRRIQKSQLDPLDFLQRNDAYTLFKAVDGLLMTGPTGTNVCDIRVAVVDTNIKR
jgi:glycerate 2-kinase